MELLSRHQCFIYEGSASKQVPALAALIQQKLRENYQCLYLNSPAMVACMRSYFTDTAGNITPEAAAGLVLSSEKVVSTDGYFDIDLMLHKLEAALDQAIKAGYKGLFATGDMTWEFAGSKDEDSFSKLLEYEWRLEKLFRKRPELCGVCQYHSDMLPIEVVRKGLLSHKSILINETLSCINQHYAESELAAEQASAHTDLDEAITGLLKGTPP